MSNTSLNSIWNVDAHLDLTIQDLEEGLTSNIEFTKIGLIDYINNEELLNVEKLDYNVDDALIKEIIKEDLGWDLIEVRDRDDG